VDDLWATNSEDDWLIARAISFQDFQPMWSWSTNVTDGQTDGQTTCDRKTALCTIVHRAVTKPVCICAACAHSHGRIYWSIFTKIGTDLNIQK